jgi:hypothetical protein
VGSAFDLLGRIRAMTRRDLYLAFVAGVLVGALGMLAITGGRDATRAMAQQGIGEPSLVAQVTPEPALIESGPGVLPPPVPVLPRGMPPSASPAALDPDEPSVTALEPVPALLPTPRYQISAFAGQVGHGAYVIDTQTGKVWEIVGRQAPESVGKAE